jgi:hypothetical protein
MGRQASQRHRHNIGSRIEKRRCCRIVPDIAQCAAHRRYQFVEEQPAAPVRQNEFEFRIAYRQVVVLHQGRDGFAGVVASNRFVHVEQDRQIEVDTTFRQAQERW